MVTLYPTPLSMGISFTLVMQLQVVHDIGGNNGKNDLSNLQIPSSKGLDVGAFKRFWRRLSPSDSLTKQEPQPHPVYLQLGI